LRIVIASRNSHKLRELGGLLAHHSLVPLPYWVSLPAETGETFEENAVRKARAAARATELASVADDSGIVVPALGGDPGVRSARFAGESATDEENLRKLIEEMRGREDQRAEYVCALAFASPDGRIQVFEGRCEGRLIDPPRGDGGFGYDPAFVPSDLDGAERTMAELLQPEKDAISHRGRAARKLAEWLPPGP
jgi:XTP/dITP diphosphohydrolase